MRVEDRLRVGIRVRETDSRSYERVRLRVTARSRVRARIRTDAEPPPRCFFGPFEEPPVACRVRVWVRVRFALCTLAFSFTEYIHAAVSMWLGLRLGLG